MRQKIKQKIKLGKYIGEYIDMRQKIELGKYKGNFFLCVDNSDDMPKDIDVNSIITFIKFNKEELQSNNNYVKQMIVRLIKNNLNDEDMVYLLSLYENELTIELNDGDGESVIEAYNYVKKIKNKMSL
jgi:hypothetical protein